MLADNKMKKEKPKSLNKAVVITLSSLCGFSVANVMAATATLTILARLVKAIDITINESLDFGTLAMTANRTGSAVLDPNVNQLFVKSNSSLSLAGGEPRAGQVQIRGASLPVAISVEDTIVKLTNGTSSVTVNNFKFLNATKNNKITVTPLGATSTLTLALGATINTKIGQLSGSYIGTNKIFVNYQ
jgi:hypothetical protein